ncbi:MAG: hypothetical protein CBD35_04440 [Verrucomicrobia bacterium TMED175]|nr:MAG: hypothetical protein CBD35_04440 [Verrucomicrobia bacterium TMED175]|tara:strand:+ start:351 stop:644 length:294 start_codon:yes stop_codon:yes gene_type:complete
MDSISGDSPKEILPKNISGNLFKNSSVSNNLEAGSRSNPTNLDALNQLTKNSITSSPDIREDKIREARKLLNDPNWLSDENLDLLSAKILQVEQFDS